MPRVRTYDQQVSSRAAATPYQNISTPAAAFGGAEAEAMVNAGQGLVVASRPFDKAAEENAAFEAQEYVNEAQKRMNDFFYDPEKGLFTRKGQNAFGAAKDTEKQFRIIKDQLMMKASGGLAKRALQQSLSRLQESSLSQAQRHELQEAQAWKGQVTDATKTTALEAIALNPDDDALFDEKYKTAISAVLAKSAIEGTADEARDMAVRDVVSKAHATRVVSMAERGQPQDIMKAADYYQAKLKSGEIGLEEKAKLESYFDAALPKAAAEDAFGKILNRRPGLEAARAAEGKDVDPSYVATVAYIESGGNPNAKNPNSTASGLFQFTAATAAQYGINNRFDPQQATEGMARFTADNKRALTASLGREPTNAELYLAHQQGAGGAAKLLKHPNERAADLVGRDAVLLNGGSEDMTAEEFARMWTDKYKAVSLRTAVGAAGVDLTAVQSEAAKLEEQYPGAGQLLIARAEKYNNDLKAAREMRKTDTKENAFRLLEDNGYDLSALPAQVVADARELGVYGDVANYAKQGGYDDPAAVLELDLMTSDQLASADLGQYAARLSRATRDAYAKKQRDLSDPANKVAGDKIDAVIAYKWQGVYGTNPLRAGADASEKNKFARFKRFVVQEVETMREGGKNPGNRELAEIADALLSNRAIDPPGLFNRVSGDIYQMDIEDIPEEERAQIEAALSSVNRPVTEEAVISLYAIRQRESLISPQGGAQGGTAYD